MESLRESIQERAKHKQEYDRKMNDRMMQSKEGKVDSSKALDAEHTTTPNACTPNLGAIIKTLGKDASRVVPTGKTFTSSTTKVDCKPPNGSNEDITNPYECDQNSFIFQEAAAPRAKVLADSPVSTSIDQDAPSTSIPSSKEHEQSPIISQGFD
ncbi:hypothetical protein Tco_0414864 [Tanacetum coccineum]